MPVARLRGCHRVTNIYVDQRIIVNEGPDFQLVQQFSSDSIQTVEVRHERDRGRVREGRRWSEGEVVVAAPEIPAAAEGRSVEPPKILDRLESVERATGWEGVQDPERRRALQEQWAEASGEDVERFRALEAEEISAERC